MSKKMFLLFSHKLTPKQIEDAKESFGIEEFVYLPENLQKKWSAVEPFASSLVEYVKDFTNYLRQNATKNDVVLVQGDFGLTYLLVKFCKEEGIYALYATTKREVIAEKDNSGKIVKTTRFKHIRFREYGV